MKDTVLGAMRNLKWASSVTIHPKFSKTYQI